MSRLPKTTKYQRGPEGPQAPTDSDAQEPLDAQASSTGIPSARDAVVSSVRLLRFPAIRERVGLSRSTVWRLERRGEFPKHRRISANAVAWIDEEVMTWIRSRT